MAAALAEGLAVNNRVRVFTSNVGAGNGRVPEEEANLSVRRFPDRRSGQHAHLPDGSSL